MTRKCKLILYQPHSVLDGKSPFEAYHTDAHDIRMLSVEVVADAFLSCEKRKVDKAGCISFCSQKYEVESGLSMIHRDVEVVYDPADISTVTIECEGFPACQAKPLVITGHAAPKPKLLEHFEKTEPQTSRLFDAAARKNEKRREIKRTAISFSGMEGGGQ